MAKKSAPVSKRSVKKKTAPKKKKKAATSNQRTTKKKTAKKSVAKKAASRTKTTKRKATAAKAKPRAGRGPHHVILGAGPAGINAIETIRSIDGGASRITLVCDEPPYARMVLPYYLAGNIPEKQVFTGDDNYLKRLGVDGVFGRRAVFVDAKANAVILQDGQKLDYDNLLVATGSSAIRPRIDGADLPGVSTLWTLADTQHVLKRLKPGARVILVGAGFIGFIVLNALAKRGCGLDVVERERAVLPNMLDARGAEAVEGHLRGKNIGVHTGTTVESIRSEDDGTLVASLDRGSELRADAIILAVGVQPKIRFLEDSGLKTRHGVLVDNRMRTNVRNVYAAGDCAEGPNLLNGAQAVHAIQPTAVDHGRVAGANMAGKRVNYRGSLSLNILDVVGLQCASFGQWNADAETQTIANPGRPGYRKLVWDGDRVTGAILIGPSADISNLNDMGMVKGIIQTQTPLGVWKQHLRDNPLDIRRAYIGAGVAQTLLKTTLLGDDSTDRDYRFKNAMPNTRPSPHHKTFVRDFVEAQPGVAGPPH
jgi:NAD(P)H-nitrite reductase large subunit